MSLKVGTNDVTMPYSKMYVGNTLVWQASTDTWTQFLALCNTYKNDSNVGTIATGVLNNQATIENLLTTNGNTITDYTTIFAWKYDNTNWEIFFLTTSSYYYDYNIKVSGVTQKIKVSSMSESQMIQSSSGTFSYSGSTSATQYTSRVFIGIFTKNANSGTLPTGCVAVVNS